MSAHDHVVIARTTVVIVIVGPLVDDVIGLAGEPAAQVDDRFEAVLGGEFELVLVRRPRDPPRRRW